MERLLRTIFNIVFFLGFHTNPSLSDDPCRTYTYFEVPGAQPSKPVTVVNSDCRSYCFGNNSCNGFTQQNGNCLLNTGAANDLNYNASSSVYTAISRNANSCNAAKSCSYWWTGNKNTFGNGGKSNGMSTINTCIASCQSDDNCNALDWDINTKSCFIFNFTGFATASTTDVYHFSKSCLPISSTIKTTTLPAAASSQSSLSSSSSTITATTVATTGTTTGTTVTRSETSFGSILSTVSSVMSPSTAVSTSTPISITNSSKDSDWYPLAIKPAYVVLAGLGGGCLLLVITAVVILCEYPMNATETYSPDGVVVKTKGKRKTQPETINMDSTEGVEAEENPYYDPLSELDPPDLTKDTYLM